MAQYRSRWTGEEIDDAVDKVRKIAYINLNGNPQEAYEAAEAAYSAGFDIVARYDRNMGVGTLIQSFELLCVLRQQTKNSSQQTSTYYWFRSFVTHTSLKLAFKLGCDYGSTTAILEDITATYQWEATQETLGIQEQSNDDIAEHDIPEGSYVYFKAGVAKAITNIAIGDTLRAVSPNKNLAWVSNGGLNDLKSALTDIENDLSAIRITGSTNNTGITIPKGYFFRLNGRLVRSLNPIPDGATLTKGTNYVEVITGALQGIPHFQNVTKTTSSAGVFDSGVPFANVISAKLATSGVNYYCMIRTTADGNAAVYVFNGANFSPVANETVTVTLCVVN